MEVLWARPDNELTAREVAATNPGYAYTTVATVLDRLAQKGFAHRRMEGRVKRFGAVDTQAGYTVGLMREALDGSSDPAKALARFAQTLSSEEARLLRS
jgi:predicted transcriptional regulator